jgi:transposase
MDAILSRCAGLDLHKDQIWACRLVVDEHGRTAQTIRRFGAMTSDIEALGAWLAEAGVTDVVMESTGVYWKPVWNLLEDQFHLVLANAHAVKNLPGRKTDVADCAWLATLLQHGLVRGSFVPDRAQRELRELTRYRTSVIQERARTVNRIHKTLEGANIKLTSVVSDLQGVSAQAILHGLAAGTADPEALVALVTTKLKASPEELGQALRGRVGPHQQFLLARQLRHLDQLDEEVAALDAEVAERERPFEPIVERLDGIPGVGRRVAEVILAEVGPTVAPFPSVDQFAAWTGVCPGNDESAGKRRKGTSRKGAPALKTALVEAAHATQRKKDCYLGAQYRKLRGRIGAKKAALAVAHSIAVSVYYMLLRDEPYQGPPATHLDTLHHDAQTRRHVRALRALGYEVDLTKPEAA